MLDNIYNVILVEPNVLCCATLKNMIKTLPNFNVTSIFDNAEDAISYLESNSVDVVIMDVNLPNIDGIMASKIIKNCFNKVKILLLSSDDSQALTSLLGNAEGYYMRDFSLTTLKSVLENIVNNVTVIDYRIRYKLWKHIDETTKNHFQITFYNDEAFLNNINNLELDNGISTK